MMSVRELTNEENELIRQCLRAAADGPFFPDWEFETLIGASRQEVRALGVRWPAFDDTRRAIEIAAASMNNLLGYPHGEDLDVPATELSELLKRVLSIGSDD